MLNQVGEMFSYVFNSTEFENNYYTPCSVSQSWVSAYTE